MPLSPVVAEYFSNWINQDTWDSGHGKDDERFYKFVRAVVRFSRRGHRISETELRDLIIARYKGKRAYKLLELKAEKYSMLYQSLCEFSDVLFPDPLIHTPHIHRYYNALLSSYGAGEPWPAVEREIGEAMRKRWGDDWEKQMGR